MDYKQTTAMHKTLCRLIFVGNFSTAIKELRGVTQSPRFVSISQRLDEISSSYEAMTNYFVEGIVDPKRDVVYNNLCERLYDIIDDWKQISITENRNPEDADNKIASTMRAVVSASLSDYIKSYLEYNANYQLRKLVDTNAIPAQESVDIMNKIFDCIWLQSLTLDNYNLIEQFINNDEIPDYDRALIVGALFMSMVHRFTTHKAELLFRLCSSPSTIIAGRAYVAVIFTFVVYNNRIVNIPSLMSILDAMIDDRKKQSMLFNIFAVVERSRMVKIVEQKVTNDLSPGLKNMRSMIDEKLGLDKIFDRNTSFATWDDMLLKNPKLKDSFEQLAQWQMEGVDIFLPSFRHLKTMRFFKKISNWLLPFYEQHPELVKMKEKESEAFRTSFVPKVGMTNALCNSDKYSILLSLAFVPARSKDMMCSMYESEFCQDPEMTNILSGAKASDEDKIAVAANHFVQDLYRLFMASDMSEFLPEIFDTLPLFRQSELFNHVFPVDEYSDILTDFYVNCELYEDAAALYDKKLAQAEFFDVSTARKAAHCHIKAGNPEVALDLLLHVDISDAENEWTKLKIAHCYRKLNKYTTSLSYLRQAEKMNPDSMTIKYNIGCCYLEMEDYNEALKYFYEIEYSQPSNSNVLRPIAWCAFVENRIEQAEAYLNKIDQKELTSHDFMIFGHVYLCQGKMQEALKMYHNHILSYDNLTPFITEFQEDIKHLKSNGLSQIDVNIMFDIITNKATTVDWQ